MAEPVARSPVRPADPVAVIGGWEVSTKRSTATLRLADVTPLAKVLVRAGADSEIAAVLGAPRGRAVRDGSGALVVRAGPDEWLVLGPVGSGKAIAETLAARAGGGHVSVVDLTHGRALLRLSGPAAPEVLAKVCAVPLDDAAAPDGTALRTSVAAVATDVVRDDRNGSRSYLLGCERSSGQYLFDALLDAGLDHGIDPDGFPEEDAPSPPPS